MKIWYDVSDLVGWNLPHLTGIQRTSVGILNGLVEHGSPVGLLRYDEKSGRFCTMSESELPATVRCHLHGFAAETVASAVEAAAAAAPLCDPSPLAALAPGTPLLFGPVYPRALRLPPRPSW